MAWREASSPSGGFGHGMGSLSIDATEVELDPSTQPVSDGALRDWAGGLGIVRFHKRARLLACMAGHAMERESESNVAGYSQKRQSSRSYAKRQERAQKVGKEGQVSR